jgi:catechol 2,3-dioxygenase-like lactoylglutathione lyase family enzyme
MNNPSDFASGAPLSFALISVQSLERSLQFYCDVIGLTCSDIVTVPAFQGGAVDGEPRAARMAMCGEPGVGIGRVLLVEFAGARRETVRQSGDRTTRGFWNLNFYVDDIEAATRQLRALGYEFWSDPVTYNVGAAAGTATEVVFEGPDSIAINLVQPLGEPDTFVGRVRAEVARHGKTRAGFTPVATTAHCVRDLAAAQAFYTGVLGMRVVLDEYLGRPETNRFLARPADARTHTVFVAGGHFYGKVALNEPQNFIVPERVERAHAPNIGYLAQGFELPELAAVQRLLSGSAGIALDFSGVPGLEDRVALQVAIPGSGGLAILVAPR